MSDMILGSFMYLKAWDCKCWSDDVQICRQIFSFFNCRRNHSGNPGRRVEWKFCTIIEWCANSLQLSQHENGLICLPHNGLCGWNVWYVWVICGWYIKKAPTVRHPLKILQNVISTHSSICIWLSVFVLFASCICTYICTCMCPCICICWLAAAQYIECAAV